MSAVHRDHSGSGCLSTLWHGGRRGRSNVDMTSAESRNTTQVEMLGSAVVMVVRGSCRFGEKPTAGFRGSGGVRGRRRTRRPRRPTSTLTTANVVIGPLTFRDFGAISSGVGPCIEV